MAKVPEVEIYNLFPPSQLSLFLLYGQRFLRYRPFFKNSIFEHETWQVAKVPEVAHILSFYPWVEIELIFALRAAVSVIQVDFQNCHIWARNLAKVPEVVNILSLYPRRVKIELIFALRTAVYEM